MGALDTVATPALGGFFAELCDSRLPSFQLTCNMIRRSWYQEVKDQEISTQNLYLGFNHPCTAVDNILTRREERRTGGDKKKGESRKRGG